MLLDSIIGFLMAMFTFCNRDLKQKKKNIKIIKKIIYSIFKKKNLFFKLNFNNLRNSIKFNFQ